MWQDYKPTPADRLVHAMEMYRLADAVTRESVQCAILGLETPESYDRIERAAIKNGPCSFEQRRLDAIGQTVNAITRELKTAGVAT